MKNGILTLERGILSATIRVYLLMTECGRTVISKIRVPLRHLVETSLRFCANVNLTFPLSDECLGTKSLLHCLGCHTSCEVTLCIRGQSKV